MPDRLTEEQIERWRHWWREWENTDAVAICTELLALREENERLTKIVECSDRLFGAGWHESLKAVQGQPHEAAHSQLAKLSADLDIAHEENDRLKKWIARFDLQPNMGTPDA